MPLTIRTVDTMAARTEADRARFEVVVNSRFIGVSGDVWFGGSALRC
jgi:hypothetical protein